MPQPTMALTCDDRFSAIIDSDQENLNQPADQFGPLIAVCTDSSRYGCAVYTDSGIQLVADRKDSGDRYKGLDIIIQRIDPEFVIVSSVQKKLIEFIEKKFPDPSFQLIDVPNIWFCMSKGVQKLTDSELIKSKGFTEPEERSLYLATKINKSLDVCAIRAVAALECFVIQKLVANPGGQNTQSGIEAIKYSATQTQKSQKSQKSLAIDSCTSSQLMPILDMRYIDPGPVLSIDKSTLRSLNIIPDDCNGKRTFKTESKSENNIIPCLYDLLNQCQSSQGKKKLQIMLLWPLQDLDELRHRHDLIQYLVDPENRLFREQLMVHLKNVVPMASLLTRMNQTVANYRELAIIYKSLWAVIAVIDLIKSNSGYCLEILNRMIQLDSPQLRSIVDSMINVVDFEASKKEKRIQVCLGVDEEVDQKKELINNLAKFCDEVALEETIKYKDTLRKSCRVLYIPRIGFLNSIEFCSTSELTRISAFKEIDILLHTERSIYFKTKRMEELDVNAGDIACDLIDIQQSVIVKLQNDILKQTETILNLTDMCGELDCLISFSLVSFQRGYCRPEFVSVNDEIDIRQAYHPLNSVIYNVVSNDARFYNSISDRRAKVMIITGPNSSGKTTYMKTICLVIYMAHIGCYVPATIARIPTIDAILSRMYSFNSITTGLSSFATELRQINYALDRATNKSLLAIDEFGKGTQAKDGFHLLKGLIAYLASFGQNSPYVLVSTHYSRLAEHLQNYSEYILYKTLKVTRDTQKDTIVYEFKLIDGICDTSLADRVARKAGIPQSIIDRANQIRNHIIQGDIIRPAIARAA